MEKILISLRDLKIGGIEKSAIELINYLVEHRYKVTLVLERKRGELLKQLKKNVEIIEYKPARKNLISKIINGIKRIKFYLKYKNKFDFSISYATYSLTGSYVARVASKNSILWCHADYMELFKQNKEEIKKFFEEINFDEFTKIVFVAKSARENFLKVFPKQKNTYYCNNLIDSRKILKLATHSIDIEYKPEVTTFLNVSRHDEKQKKLSRILEAAYKLKKDKYKFRIIFVGKGQDTKKYIRIVGRYKLQKYIIFVGEKENPYPYFKISDCVIMSSDYEGYPVVFLESYILNKPIITTNVSDYEDIQKGRGIVTNKSEKEIYKAMKYFINNGYQIKEPFDIINYNAQIEKKLNEILKNS